MKREAAKQKLKRLLPRFVIRWYERQLAKETHINRALRLFGKDAVYVEIGVRDGSCTRQLMACRKYAIDPVPVAPEDIERDGVRVFQMTSDRFFDEAAEIVLGERSVHVALVDGLHEFRQALRDVLNLERLMRLDGFIFVHDCNPPAQRNAENPEGPWNGDVWKVAYYITHYRKDLAWFTLDCDWGLGVLSGFSRFPGSSPDPAAIEAVASLDYAVLDNDRDAILHLRSPLSSLPYFVQRRLAGHAS